VSEISRQADLATDLATDPALAVAARKPASRFALLWRSRWLGVAFIAGLLVLWEVVAASGVMPAMSFPRMSAILATWWDLVISGELPGELLPSLWRMFAGYAIGVVLGIVLGLLMGYVRFFYNLLEPITEVLRPIPSPAYLPIVILFLGIDDEMKIFMIAFASLFPVLLNTYSGVRSVDPVQLQTARTFGASRRQVWAWVIFPAVLPQVFTMLRINFFAAWMAVLAAEMVGLKNGVGMIVILGREMFNPNLIMLGICIIGVTGYAVDALLLFVQRKIFWWKAAE